MQLVTLPHQPSTLSAEIPLPSSKSESNRALIIDALTGFQCKLHNLSTARDTQTLIRLLASTDDVADVIDAGTTMRFLTAYFAATNQPKLLTGTPRMCERPIGLLTDALTSLGVDISFEGKVGFPPHRVHAFPQQLTNEIHMAGNVSSQYISALLLIAPTLPQGLTLYLTGEIGSKPYITMTIALMQSFGVEVETNWQEQWLRVSPQKYSPCTYHIESDWSGASYWYSFVALSASEYTTVELLGLKPNSLQGDSAIVAIMEKLGVASEFTERGVRLTKKESVNHFVYDFAACPDLVQTVAVVCAAKGIQAEFTGIESLKIKETNRVLALQNELAKIGGQLAEVESNHRYVLTCPTLKVPEVPFETYDDHRMAMAFAPLCMKFPIQIEEPNVVVKSYPSFWEDVQQVAPITIG